MFIQNLFYKNIISLFETDFKQLLSAKNTVGVTDLRIVLQGLSD